VTARTPHAATASACRCSCAKRGCGFASIGHLIVNLRLVGRHLRFGICAVHKPDALRDAISDPMVESVQFDARRDWSVDGGAPA
jgi:hypothetical protein